MVLCNVECVQKIADYVGVPGRKVYMSENNIVASDDVMENERIEGFGTIVQALVADSKDRDILGRNKLEQALARQWLEYAILYTNYADLPSNSRKILKELNVALQKSTYICGTNQTIADITLYYTLHSIMKKLNHQEKAEHVNVSRWFDNIQQDEKLRRNLELVNFDLLYLYL